MKKIFALILAVVMVLSFASCDDKKAPKTKESTKSSRVTEDFAEVSKEDAGPKRTSKAATKLLRFYEDILQNSTFTMTMTTTMSNMKSEVLVARSGDMMYSESKVGGLVMKQVVRDATQYLIYPNGKIMKVSYPGPIKLPQQVNIIDENQLSYYEKYSSSGNTSYNGKNYSYEEFSISSVSVRYLFDGDDLKYVIQKVGQLESVSEIDIKYSADSSLFDVPKGDITEMKVPQVQ